MVKHLSVCQSRRCKRHAFGFWVRKIPRGRQWKPTPVFLPGKVQDRGAGGLQPTGPNWLVQSFTSVATDRCAPLLFPWLFAGGFHRAPLSLSFFLSSPLWLGCSLQCCLCFFSLLFLLCICYVCVCVVALSITCNIPYIQQFILSLWGLNFEHKPKLYTFNTTPHVLYFENTFVFLFWVFLD